MKISRSAADDTVDIRASLAEAKLLSAYMVEAAYAHSPAELYIRTGGSQANLLDVLAALDQILSARRDSVDVELELGSEAVENPPRPRVPRPKSPDG